MNFIFSLILLTNITRTAAHLIPLLPDQRLTAMAQYRANEMCSGNISHDDFAPAIKKFIPNELSAGENIAYQFQTPETINKAFLNSPEHRINVLGPNYLQIGIGTCGQVVVVEYGLLPRF
jgi:uncharacterized protein YkwD